MPARPAAEKKNPRDDTAGDGSTKGLDGETLALPRSPLGPFVAVVVAVVLVALAVGVSIVRMSSNVVVGASSDSAESAPSQPEDSASVPPMSPSATAP